MSGRLEHGQQSRQDSTARTRAKSGQGPDGTQAVDAAFARAETEDDDGYDPWSDRPARREPLFEADPWR